MMFLNFLFDGNLYVVAPTIWTSTGCFHLLSNFPCSFCLCSREFKLVVKYVGRNGEMMVYFRGNLPETVSSFPFMIVKVDRTFWDFELCFIIFSLKNTRIFKFGDCSCQEMSSIFYRVLCYLFFPCWDCWGSWHTVLHETAVCAQCSCASLLPSAGVCLFFFLLWYVGILHCQGNEGSQILPV